MTLPLPSAAPSDLGQRDDLRVQLPLDLSGYDAPSPAVPARRQKAEAVELLSRVDLGAALVDKGAEDLLRATSLVVGIGGLDHQVRAIKVFGDPWSKSRPRFTRQGHTYQTPEDNAAEKAMAATLVNWIDQPYTGNVALAAIFYRSNRQRIDTDNLLKHVCDSANEILWADDSQVTAVVGVTELDPGLPRTVIALAPHVSTLTRGTDWTSVCVRCGDNFVVDTRHTAKRYCSDLCSAEARGHVLGAPVPCAHCGEPFRRKTTSQRFCTVQCRGLSTRGVPKGTKAFSFCTDCNKELTHRRGGRCRQCWAKRATGHRSEELA